MNSTFGRSSATDTTAKKKGSRESNRIGQIVPANGMIGNAEQQPFTWKKLNPCQAKHTNRVVKSKYRMAPIKTIDLLNACY